MRYLQFWAVVYPITWSKEILSLPLTVMRSSANLTLQLLPFDPHQASKLVDALLDAAPKPATAGFGLPIQQVTTAAVAAIALKNFIWVLVLWGSRPVNTPSPFQLGITSPDRGIYLTAQFPRLGEVTTSGSRNTGGRSTVWESPDLNCSHHWGECPFRIWDINLGE